MKDLIKNIKDNINFIVLFLYGNISMFLTFYIETLIGNIILTALMICYVLYVTRDVKE